MVYKLSLSHHQAGVKTMNNNLKMSDSQNNSVHITIQCPACDRCWAYNDE